ncbi:hypothetical protein M0R45_034655 [Rubus argutus]|uniref:USP domain-containing protein n=1 Tax=Rubus argutus TaxID=59490 RepID=A0AAW1VQT0_RUBAR
MDFLGNQHQNFEDDTVIIEPEVLIPRVVDYSTYDSKKETGFVGLKNQGATCYVNSLLQTLYHIPSFREVICLLPTTENDMPSQSILHDVQELNRFLHNKLEDSMKGTVAEGTMQKLFEGHRMNYIECLNVDCKSSIKDSFYDIQLDVKGFRDVYASFDNYVKVERLEGDNKYGAEQNGLQDANKRVLFIDFPPVLQLQLK